jgi:hypothetical protein
MEERQVVYGTSVRPPSLVKILLAAAVAVPITYAIAVAFAIGAALLSGEWLVGRTFQVPTEWLFLGVAPGAVAGLIVGSWAARLGWESWIPAMSGGAAGGIIYLLPHLGELEAETTRGIALIALALPFVLVVAAITIATWLLTRRSRESLTIVTRDSLS